MLKKCYQLLFLIGCYFKEMINSLIIKRLLIDIKYWNYRCFHEVINDFDRFYNFRNPIFNDENLYPIVALAYKNGYF